MLDFSKVFTGEQTYADVVAGLTPADLPRLTTEILDAVEARLEGISDPDVVFVPRDPTPDDPETEGWTIGHVIVHLTAGLEESASLGATLARGVEVTGRSRYESPWESITTAAAVRSRLAESRNMALGFLTVWPEAPHLDNTYTRVERFGPMDAVGVHLMGYMHATMHLNQLQEIRRQAAG